MEPLVVGYDRKGLLEVVRACFCGVLLGIALTAIGFLDRNPDGINLRVVVFLAKFLGPFAAIFCLGLAISTVRRRGFALIVDPEGLTLGFLPGSPLRLSWDEVANVSRRQQLVQHRLIETLVVQPWDEPALVARLGRMGRLHANVAALTNQPIASVGLRLLDRPWEEIEDAVAAAKPFERAEIESLTRQIQSFAERLDDARTHGGTLIVPADYERVFRRAPLGSWSDTIHNLSPGDSSAGFCNDGTGWAGPGASAFMGYFTETRWREREEEFAIDVRRVEEGAEWHTFDYEFLEQNGKTVIRLCERVADESDDEDSEPYDPMNDPDDWTSAFYAVMAYEGPCRQDHPTR